MGNFNLSANTGINILNVWHHIHNNILITDIKNVSIMYETCNNLTLVFIT